MRSAGPPRQYNGASLPLLSLLKNLSQHKSVRYVHVQRGQESFLVEKGS
jgi:hypothetical protein